MMMLVSRRKLPLAGINALALLLDRLDHLPSRHGIDRGCESAKVRPLLAHRRRSGQGSHEPEHLLLRLRRQFFDLPGNLLSDVHPLVPSPLRIHSREHHNVRPIRYDPSSPRSNLRRIAAPPHADRLSFRSLSMMLYSVSRLPASLLFVLALAHAAVIVDAGKVAAPPEPLPFAAGGRSPAGHVLAVNSRYLSLDGKPWFPVMGEFQ